MYPSAFAWGWIWRPFDFLLDDIGNVTSSVNSGLQSGINNAIAATIDEVMVPPEKPRPPRRYRNNYL